jgi:hypothetical protein
MKGGCGAARACQPERLGEVTDMHVHSFSATVGIFALAAAAGCTTPAEQQAQTGLDAFQRCDLRAAAQAFDDAHALDPSRADFALAYALSTIAVLPEDPHVTAFLLRLGFDKAIDTSALWGPGGVFDRLAARDASCTSISDALRAAIPYAPAQTDGPSAVSVLADPTLTGDDLVAAAVALVPRLEKLVAALEQGVGAMGEVDITGGCGVGTIHVQAPELYALASALEWLVASIEVAAAYDWGLEARVVLDTSNHTPEYVDELDAHLFHLRSAPSLVTAQQSAIHATDLLEKAIAAVPGVKPHSSALVDWSRLPARVLADVKTVADGLRQMLANPGAQPLPLFSPALAMDALSFFTTPVDLSNVQPPIWSTGSYAGGGYSVSASTDGEDAVLGPRFSPDPFPNGAPGYSFTLFSGWNDVSSSDWTATFDPNQRWEGAYGCTN